MIVLRFILAIGLSIVLGGCAYLNPDWVKLSAQDYWWFGREKGSNEKALELLDSVIRAHPRDVQAYLFRATVYATDNQPSKALDDCTAALNVEPRNARILAVRGLLKLEKSPPDTGEASPDLNMAVLYGANDGWTYLYRAIARYKLGDKAGASSDVEKAVACNSKNVATWSDVPMREPLSSMLRLLGHYERASISSDQSKEFATKEMNKHIQWYSGWAGGRRSRRSAHPSLLPPPSQLPICQDSGQMLGIIASQRLNALEDKERLQSEQR